MARSHGEGIQAVVLADSFTNTFRPLTLDVPKVLLPVVNVPMIEYTLEWLASQDVDEIFVLCCAHAEMIESYLKTTRWHNSTSPKIHVTRSDTCTSAGDALREVYDRKIITSDPFVLVSGDVISSMHLGPVIAAHKERRKTDKNCIMTMVFKPTSATHPTQQLHDDIVVTYDQDTLELVGYDNDPRPSALFATLATNLLRNRAAAVMQRDLLDCNIDICSPEVLMQFADNYDYQNIRRDYVHNEVQSKEIGWKFSAFFTHEYAARIQDLRTYDSICKDIVQRWTYPIVPDSNFTGKTTFALSRGSVYKEEGLQLAPTALGNATLVGAGSVLGTDTWISRTTVGRGCRIGSRVVIEGSYVWDNVVIEDGVTIDRAIICTGVHIAANTHIPRGVVLSFNCAIGRGATLPPFARYTTAKVADDEFGQDDEEVAAEGAAAGGEASDVEPSLGEGGRGRLWTAGEWELEGQEWYPGDDDDDMEALTDRIHAISMGADELELLTRQRWAAWPSAEDEENLLDGDVAGEVVCATFEDTVREMVQTCIAKGATHDNIVLEVGSYMRSEDRGWDECVGPVLSVVLDLAPYDLLANAQQFLGGLQKTVQAWAPMVAKFVNGTEAKKMAVWMAAIVELERFVLDDREEERAAMIPFFGFALQFIWEADIVADEAVEAWAGQRRAMAASEPVMALFNHSFTQNFLNSMNASSSSGESGDDSDSGSD